MLKRYWKCKECGNQVVPKWLFYHFETKHFSKLYARIIDNMQQRFSDDSETYLCLLHNKEIMRSELRTHFETKHFGQYFALIEDNKKLPLEQYLKNAN